MKRFNVTALLLVLPIIVLHAQFDKKLKEDIRNTGYVHSPLPLDYSKSFEAFGLKKKVIDSMMLCDMESIDKWSHKGIGGVSVTPERKITGKSSLRLVAPTTVDTFLSWALVSALQWQLMKSAELTGRNITA
jgi:hypothetical protein